MAAKPQVLRKFTVRCIFCLKLIHAWEHVIICECSITQVLYAVLRRLIRLSISILHYCIRESGHWICFLSIRELFVFYNISYCALTRVAIKHNYIMEFHVKQLLTEKAIKTYIFVPLKNVSRKLAMFHMFNVKHF